MANKSNLASLTIPAIITLIGGVLVALISCFGSLILGYWQFVWKPSQVSPSAQDNMAEYIGRIVASGENLPIKGAKVTLDVLNPPVVVYTDSEGVYRFVVAAHQMPIRAKVIVTADGFEHYERNLTLSKDNLMVEDIRLVRTTLLTPTTSVTSVDWTKLLSIDVNLPLSQCPDAAFPPNIDPEHDALRAAEQASKAKLSKEVDSWPIVGSDYGTDLELTITNLLNRDTTWIKLPNSVKVIVNADLNIPDHTKALNLAWGCGGEGHIRTYSGIQLSDDFQTYSQNSTTEEFDFLTLQPGEFEVISLPFYCRAPGIYLLSFEIPYQLIDQSDTLVFEYERPIICPRSYTSWILEGGSFVSASNFTWDGQHYQDEP